MISKNVCALFIAAVVTFAASSEVGEYVPKALYFIDEYGHQSEPVYVRNRRNIMENIMSRVKRGGEGGGGAYASSQASASANAGSSSNNYQDYIPSVARDPASILQHVLNNIPGAGAGTNSFASSSSSASSGNGAGGPSSGQSYGGLGAGQQAGYQGPVLFSRFGETEGTGVHVTGQAQGQNGAFSASSSNIDDTGKIKYSVQSGKY